MAWRSVALARSGQDAAAAEAFADFLAQHPGSPRAPEAGAMLGWLLFETGHYDSARRRFAEVGASAPARVRESAAKGLEAVERVNPGAPPPLRK